MLPQRNVRPSARRWRIFGVIAPFAVLALAIVFVPISVPLLPTTRTFTIHAEQFEFRPGRIEVAQGDRVVITLTSSDVMHGFQLPEFGVDQQVVPGTDQTFEFVADKVGKFHFRCSVVCGALHPFMQGELVVTPNVPYWRAVGLALTGVGCLLLYRGIARWPPEPTGPDHV